MKSPGLLCAVLCALGFLPLLGGFRYEAALVAGLLAPSFAACVAFAEGRRRALSALSEQESRPVDWAPWAAAIAARHSGAILLAAMLHDLWRGTCEFWPGLTLVFLGPVAGTFLGAAFGATTGVLVISLLWRRWPRRCAWAGLGLVGPLATAAFAVFEFSCGPAVYAYDPFAGYFAGPLYDTIPFDLERLVLFRAGSVLTWLAFWLFGRALVWNPTVKTKALGGVRSLGLGVGVVLALGSVAHAGLAPRLGLETTDASLARELSGRAADGVCRVHASPWVSPKVARRTAWECARHVRSLRRHFELSPTDEGPPIVVHLFANAEEKGRLMGARTTYLAKPWRREIFVQVDAFPHPVLRHELAHAVTAEFGSGPFRIAGGLFPDPGRIEGFAVAAALTEDGDATEAEWARALLDLGQLPPSRSLFSLGFLGSAAVKSYTSAGAFVDYLHTTYGASLMKRWYRGEDLEKLTGRRWAELDLDYRARLLEERVSPRVRALAEEIFSRPSVFGRSCPHAADRALEEARALCPVNAGEAERAVRRALALDATRRDAEGLLPGCYLGAGELARAADLLAKLRQDPGVSGREKVRALVTSADLAWVGGRVEEARLGYDEALRGALTGPEVRSVTLKRWAIERPEPVGSAVRRWLAAGEPGGGDAAARLAALWDWYEMGPDRGIAAYLLGLQLLDGDARRGRTLLVAALESQELEPAFAIEAQRRLALAACLSGDTAEVETWTAALARQQEASVQRRRAARLRQLCHAGPPP